MSDHPFKTFINLITFDQHILSIEQQVAQLHRDIADAQAKITISNNQLDVAKEKAHAARKYVDECELENKGIDEQEKAKKRQLDALSHYKDYQSIKNEIDALKAKQHALEQVVLEAWNVLEAAQKEHELAKQAHERVAVELDAAIADKLKVIKELEHSVQQLIEQRPEKEKQVPAEWLEKYVMMRSKVSDPVVPVVQGSCSACYHQVSEQDMMLLKRRKLLSCQGCYRLLYSTEIIQGSTEAS